MKILLIYPQCPDSFWSFKHALKFISKKAAVPPLGIITVSAMLPSYMAEKTGGYEYHNTSNKRHPMGRLCFYQRHVYSKRIGKQSNC